MSRAPYDGLARFRATLQVALWLCDEMARTGREESDAPRLLVQAGIEWTENQDTRALTRVRKVFDRWQKPIWPLPQSDPYNAEDHIRWKWVRAISSALDGRNELVKRPRVGADRYEFSLACAVELVVAMGEPPDATAHRLCLMYDRFVGYESPESTRRSVELSARREADKIREWSCGKALGKSA